MTIHWIINISHRLILYMINCWYYIVKWHQTADWGVLPECTCMHMKIIHGSSMYWLVLIYKPPPPNKNKLWLKHIPRMTYGQWGFLTKVNLILQTFTMFWHGVNVDLTCIRFYGKWSLHQIRTTFSYSCARYHKSNMLRIIWLDV